MSGLILKDFLVMRKSLKVYGIMLVIYLALVALGMLSVTFFITVFNILIMMLPMSTFSWDELARWDRYAMTLPLGRRRVVGARYLFALLLTLCAGTISLFLCAVASILNGEELMLGITIEITALTAGLLMLDLMLPILYRLGPERGRPWLFVIIFLPVLAIAGAARFGVIDSMDFRWINDLPAPAFIGLVVLVPVLAIAGFGASYLISCRIAEKKEF